MASFISSELDCIQKHPNLPSSFQRVEHELQYIKRRERASGLIAIASTITAIVVLAGVLGGGHIIFGALAAIALIGFLYAYFCREAESALRERQVRLIPPR